MEERFGQYSKRRCLIYMEDTFRNKLTRKQASKKKLILFELHRSYFRANDYSTCFTYR